MTANYLVCNIEGTKKGVEYKEKQVFSFIPEFKYLVSISRNHDASANR